MTWWKYPMKPVKIAFSQASSLALGEYWLEKKYDGHRAILLAEGGQKKLVTRMNVPIAIPENMKQSLDAIEIQDGTVLDGEIWNPLKRGGWTSDSKEPSVLTFWDCLKDGERNISLLPIEARRSTLLRILREAKGHVRVAEQENATEDRMKQIYEETKKARAKGGSRSGFVHGVVFKRRGSVRRDHATRSQEHADWIKVVFDVMPGWIGKP